MTESKNKPAASAAEVKDPIDEIDQIMNEIEQLQQGMSDAQAAPAQAQAAAAAPVVEESNELQEFRGSGDDASMEETLANLKDDQPAAPNLIDQAIEAEAAGPEITEENDLTQEAQPMAEVHTMARPVRLTETTAEAGDSASVALTLTGNMTLKLSYEFEGQAVTIGFKDGSLCVELSDGMEFKVPVRRNSLRKAA